MSARDVLQDSRCPAIVRSLISRRERVFVDRQGAHTQTCSRGSRRGRCRPPSSPCERRKLAKGVGSIPARKVTIAMNFPFAGCEACSTRHHGTSVPTGGFHRNLGTVKSLPFDYPNIEPFPRHHRPAPAHALAPAAPEHSDPPARTEMIGISCSAPSRQARLKLAVGKRLAATPGSQVHDERERVASRPSCWSAWKHLTNCTQRWHLNAVDAIRPSLRSSMYEPLCQLLRTSRSSLLEMTVGTRARSRLLNQRTFTRSRRATSGGSVTRASRTGRRPRIQAPRP